MTKKKKRGGSRNGAGRKPSEDPKKPITIYVATSVLDKVPEPKAVAIKALEKEAKKY